MFFLLSVSCVPGHISESGRQPPFGLFQTAGRTLGLLPWLSRPAFQAVVLPGSASSLSCERLYLLSHLSAKIVQSEITMSEDSCFPQSSDPDHFDQRANWHLRRLYHQRLAVRHHVLIYEASTQRYLGTVLLPMCAANAARLNSHCRSISRQPLLRAGFCRGSQDY